MAKILGIAIIDKNAQKREIVEGMFKESNRRFTLSTFGNIEDAQAYMEKNRVDYLFVGDIDDITWIERYPYNYKDYFVTYYSEITGQKLHEQYRLGRYVPMTQLYNIIDPLIKPIKAPPGNIE